MSYIYENILDGKLSKMKMFVVKLRDELFRFFFLLQKSINSLIFNECVFILQKFNFINKEFVFFFVSIRSISFIFFIISFSF